MSFDEIARSLSIVIGSGARYQPITLEAFHAEMTKIGGELIADVLTGVCRKSSMAGTSGWVMVCSGL
jgi:hypothetical protein